MGIYPNLDIKYTCRTHVQREGAQLLDLLMTASWISLMLYGFWFIFRARQHVPMSPRDAYVLWSLHKREAGCGSPRYVLKLHKKKGVIGFKCACGYEYESKRPIIG